MPKPHLVMFAAIAISLSDFMLILRATRKTATVISITLGEQYRKNSSISCSEQSGLAVIALNPI